MGVITQTLDTLCGYSDGGTVLLACKRNVGAVATIIMGGEAHTASAPTLRKALDALAELAYGALEEHSAAVQVLETTAHEEE